MRTLIIFSIFLFSFNINAQSFGYMGKRNILSGEIDVSGSYYKIYKDKSLWVKYGGNFETIISKRVGLGFGYDYGKSKYEEKYTDGYYNYFGFNLNSKTYSINCNIYSKNSIAPIGNFIRLRVFMIQNISNDFYSNGSPKPGFDPHSFQGLSQDYISAKNYGFSIEWGYRRILFNSLVLTLSTQFGYTLSNPASKLSDLINVNNTAVLGYDAFNEFVLSQNFRSNFFAIKLGIGGII